VFTPKAAGLVFFSGTAPHDPATSQINGTTIQEQARQCLTNPVARLEQLNSIPKAQTPARETGVARTTLLRGRWDAKIALVEP